jgi:hypothetical protein
MRKNSVTLLGILASVLLLAGCHKDYDPNRTDYTLQEVMDMSYQFALEACSIYPDPLVRAECVPDRFKDFLDTSVKESMDAGLPIK